MTFAGKIEPGMHERNGGQGQRNKAAQARATHAVADHEPAGTGGKRAEPQRRADGIDHQEHKDDTKASDRGAEEVGGIEPSATIRQPRQQQRDADTAFGERVDEGNAANVSATGT